MRFCGSSNFGGTRGSFMERQRELHAASAVAAELTAFSPLPLSRFLLLPFLFPPPFFRWLAAGREAAPSREEGELLRQTASDRGPRRGPMPCAWLGGLP